MSGRGGPPAGTKVVELAGIGSGPHAAMLLADIGAYVVRAERPDVTDHPVPPELDVLRRSHRPS
ncbi:CoA transferase [Mycobacterium sp. E1747]|uniref:CoA transferase n=1 Tax=Mycobacterium sp. E1747 TaxID=1834128 RepID=UPI003511138E